MPSRANCDTQILGNDRKKILRKGGMDRRMDAG